MTATSECRTCRAPIVWCRTERGNAMPVDAQPLLVGGNVELVERPGQDPLARVLGDPSVSSRPLYVSHFVTCSHADQHRRLRPDGKRR